MTQASRISKLCVQEAVPASAVPALGTKSVPALVRTLSPGRLATFAPNETRKVGIAFEQEEAGAMR